MYVITVIPDSGRSLTDYKDCRMENNHHVEHIEITSKGEWDRVTSDVESDNHETGYNLQLQYHNCHENEEFIPNSGFLIVNDQGEVCANGEKEDSRTYFEIIQNFMTGHYQIICKGGNCKDYILYMKGHDLKTRKRSTSRDEKDETTQFDFDSRGNGEPPFKIRSTTSDIPLQFNNMGKFFYDSPGTDHTDYNDPYYFYTYKVVYSRYSTV